MSLSDEELVKCYGKKRIVNRVDECTIRSQCRLGAMCLSCANEDAETYHFQKQNILVPNMLFDKNEDSDECNQDDKNVCEDDNFDLDEDKAELESAENSLASMESDSQGEINECINLEEISLTGEEHRAVRVALERISMLYLKCPTVFAVLMSKIYKNMNQSDVARERGVSRQAINKRLLAETGISQKRNDIQTRRNNEYARLQAEFQAKLDSLKEHEAFLHSLSKKDFLIYKCVFLDKMTYRETAKVIGCTHVAVCKHVKSINEKLDGKLPSLTS